MHIGRSGDTDMDRHRETDTGKGMNTDTDRHRETGTGKGMNTGRDRYDETGTGKSVNTERDRHGEADTGKSVHDRTANADIGTPGGKGANRPGSRDIIGTRSLVVSRSRYELTAIKPEQYPAGDLPEIALVGRSNVGKSSLINSLLNRKGLARVSSEPGKTRGINFYNVDDTMYLVDLPGYGYAKVSRKEKASWAGMIETYLHTRKQLRLVIMLVDIRHTPTGDDRLMYSWILDRGIAHMVIATKADKISRGRIQARLSEIRKTLGIRADISLTAYSSETGQGREQVWSELEKAVLEQEVNSGM